MTKPNDPIEPTITAATLRHPSAGSQPQRYRLVCLEGTEPGRAFEVGAETVHVGTSSTCAARFIDARMSRRHAAFEARAEGLVIRDLDSSNGTTVDGVHVREAILGGGNIVRMGATALRIDVLGPSDEPASTGAAAFARFVGVSPPMRRIIALATKLAASNLPLTIEGETGTGKELLAECIHQVGPRSAGPFVVADCTAIDASAIEVALFGCARATLPAYPDGRVGLLEEAAGGTVLLDEPADLPLDLQRKVARVIERAELRRIGDGDARKLDVRWITTSQADLDRAVEEGRLREDLYFRLAVTRIELVPLRRLREDVRPLAEHFWRSMGGAGKPPEAALARWEARPFPGNVREPRNAVTQLLIQTDAGAHEPREEAPAPARDDHGALERIVAEDLTMPEARQRAVASFERLYVARLLEKYGGNVSRAAAASGVAFRYFQLLKARHKS